MFYLQRGHSMTFSPCFVYEMWNSDQTLAGLKTSVYLFSRSLPSFDFHQDTDLLERNKPLAKSGWNTQDLACKRRWRCKEKGGEAGQRALPKQKIQTDWFVNLLTATYHLQVRMTEHRAYSTLRHGGCGVFQEMKRKDSAGWSPDLHFKELQQFCK